MALTINSGNHGCLAKGMKNIDEFKHATMGGTVTVNGYDIILTSEEKCLPEGWSIRYTPKRGGLVFYMDPNNVAVHPRDIRKALGLPASASAPISTLPRGNIPPLLGSTPSEQDALNTPIANITDINTLNQMALQLSGATAGGGGAPHPISENNQARIAEIAARIAELETPSNDTLQELPYDSNFFESQESLGCGRHALNNLLGGKYFIATQGPAYTLDEVKAAGSSLSLTNPLDLQRLCKYLHSIDAFIKSDDTKEDLTNACPAYENYDISVLTAALQVSGFHIDEFQTLTNDLKLQEDDLGYIVNKGYLAFDSLPVTLRESIHTNMVASWKLITDSEEYKNLSESDREALELEFTLTSTTPPKLKHFVCLRKDHAGLQYKDSLTLEKPLYTTMSLYLDTLKDEGKDLRIGTVKKRTVQQLDLINGLLEIKSGQRVNSDPEMTAAITASLET